VSGLCLQLDPSAIAEEEFAGVLNAVRALEIVLGDVVVTNMPGDEVLLGNTDRGWLGAETSDTARRFRLAYLRWRIPLIKALEGDNPWSQIPEGEDKLVRSAEDLLPNHPELLMLAPGSSIVDVCGGMGRVARRLAPAVGPHGIVISIELRRFLTERARRFAYEGNFTNLQFRPGRAERLPLPDNSVDAAVNEWTGAIWELGLGPTMVKEMARVVRPGGRIAVTHRLVQLHLDALDKPWVQYEQIYRWVRDAFRHPELTIVAERVWGQTVPSKGGENASLWVEQYMPRLVNPHDRIFPHEDPDRGSSLADVYLTMVAERWRS
jgi:ubiquinone/menaquinone biosynthesis C-methylase UbiE